MKRSSRRRARALTALVAALALLAPAPGCIGPFKALHAIHELNTEPQSPWVEEAVFLAFIILPVYGLGALVDVLILNPIDFFERL